MKKAGIAAALSIGVALCAATTPTGLHGAPAAQGYDCIMDDEVMFIPDLVPSRAPLPPLQYPLPWQRALYRPRLSFDRALLASVEAG